jgi:crossover junction endodeoxyribonuclease RuvC
MTNWIQSCCEMKTDLPFILGVDPGLGGAWAVYCVARAELVEVQDMPKTKDGDEIDTASLAVSLDFYASSLRFAVVEKVSGALYTNAQGELRGQGSAASFAFGKYTGVVYGILAAFMVPVFPIPPSVWKLKLGVTRDKASSLALAKERFPKSREIFQRKKDDGRAEAALLAFYGASFFK